jgi:hypothetical protein
MNQGGASGIGDSIGNGQGNAVQVFPKPGASHADPDRQTDREIVYRTVNCKQGFASGDRIVLLGNNLDLGVKNGMLGTVEVVEPNALQIWLDEPRGRARDTRFLSLPVND